MLAKITSDFNFFPIIHPNTTIFYCKTKHSLKTSTNGLLTSLFDIQPSKQKHYIDPTNKDLQFSLDVKDYSISWEIPHNENVSTLKTQDDIDEFKKRTYELIRKYGKLPTDTLTTLKISDLNGFADYCHRYGVPFVFSKSNGNSTNVQTPYMGSIALCDFLNIFKVLYLHLHWKETFNISNLLQSIIVAGNQARNLKYTKFELIYLSNCELDIKNENYVYSHEISWYIWPSTLKREDPIYPEFSIKLLAPQIHLLSKFIDEKDIIPLIEERLISKIVDLLNIHKPEYSFESNKICSTIRNPLLFFLLNIIMNEDKICKNPKCGKLVTNGNEYCDPKCKTEYHNSTSEGKLRALTTTWHKRYKTPIYPIQELGYKLIRQGKEWPEILKAIQEKLNSLKKEGV